MANPPKTPDRISVRRLSDLLTADKHTRRGPRTSGFLLRSYLDQREPENGYVVLWYEVDRGRATRRPTPPLAQPFLDGYRATLERHGYLVESYEAYGGPRLMVRLPPRKPRPIFSLGA